MSMNHVSIQLKFQMIERYTTYIFKLRDAFVINEGSNLPNKAVNSDAFLFAALIANAPVTAALKSALVS